MTRALVVVYDISKLTEAEVDVLELEAAVQAEASDNNGVGHPDVSVLSVRVDDSMEAVYARVQ